jgi:hypothetical protein
LQVVIDTEYVAKAMRYIMDLSERRRRYADGDAEALLRHLSPARGRVLATAIRYTGTGIVLTDTLRAGEDPAAAVAQHAAAHLELMELQHSQFGE